MNMIKNSLIITAMGWMILTGFACEKAQPAPEQNLPAQEANTAPDATTANETENANPNPDPETANETTPETANETAPNPTDPATAESDSTAQNANNPASAPALADDHFPFKSPDDAIQEADGRIEAEDFDGALQILIEAEYHFGHSSEISAAYSRAYDAHPLLNAEPKLLEIDKDVTGIKRIGGGSSLVYKLTKNKETIAAFKPFQKRFQSNYRAEIAAYRLCPLIKCGFDIPMNLPVYFDYQTFSGLYARNPANPKEEFNEIIPTKIEGTHRVEGTFKAWIPDYADYPIEFKNIWEPWLNPGTSKADLSAPLSDILPVIAKRHKGGDKFAQKLAPHLENTTKYDLARQISNMLVFDFLINNWDRFSGSPTLFGVNCQIVKGRFMSIDNGAGFPKTPNTKPDKHLHEITRFSRTTYQAIVDLEKDKDKVENILFPNPSDVERDRLATFWNQRKLFLDYVKKCIEKNGEAETFFFE